MNGPDDRERRICIKCAYVYYYASVCPRCQASEEHAIRGSLKELALEESPDAPGCFAAGFVSAYTFFALVATAFVLAAAWALVQSVRLAIATYVGAGP